MALPLADAPRPLVQGTIRRRTTDPSRLFDPIVELPVRQVHIKEVRKSIKCKEGWSSDKGIGTLPIEKRNMGVASGKREIQHRDLW